MIQSCQTTPLPRVALDRDVVVDVDLGGAPLRVPVPFRGERAQRGRSTSSKWVRRVPASFWKGRAFSRSSRSRIA
ncbi:MAG: hypothetical protein ACRDHF_19090 [Tepidiformaceae bacterium]